MRSISANDFKERALEIMRIKLGELCAKLNDEYEDYRFYVKDDSVWLDCSDYSPRDIKIY